MLEGLFEELEPVLLLELVVPLEDGSVELLDHFIYLHDVSS